ncbi:MAG TPA: hypothetical protein PK967_20465 [Candidatus Hydrogenedentes bacterium]|nr:hypothetical protein [Candidatus Hydrogenedentota bacterium]
MDTLRTGISFVSDNRDLFITLVGSLLAIIKLTAWGKAKAAALDTVTTVVEQLRATNVKNAVAAKESELTAGALDALQVSVAKADPNKTVPGPVTRLVRELFRGILPRK